MVNKNQLPVWKAETNIFFERDKFVLTKNKKKFDRDKILCLTETKILFDWDQIFVWPRSEKNSTHTPKNEYEVEGAKPPDEVERSETSGERSEPALCKS